MYKQRILFNQLILIVSLLLASCSVADIEDCSKVIGVPSFVNTQTIPQEFCGQWYCVYGDSKYGYYNMKLSPKGMWYYDTERYCTYFIDYESMQLAVRKKELFEYVYDVTINEDYILFNDASTISALYLRNHINIEEERDPELYGTWIEDGNKANSLIFNNEGYKDSQGVLGGSAYSFNRYGAYNIFLFLYSAYGSISKIFKYEIRNGKLILGNYEYSKVSD